MEATNMNTGEALAFMAIAEAILQGGPGWTTCTAASGYCISSQTETNTCHTCEAESQ